MKRNSLLIAAACLTAALVSTPFAAGQVGVQKGYPAAVTATGTKSFKKRPYKLALKGTMTLPTKACAAGAKPAIGATNCLPVKCPPGVTNIRYCGLPSSVELCIGKLRLTIKRGSRTIVKKNITLKTTCAYSVKVSFKKKPKKGTLKVSVRFLGNPILNALSAKTLKVKVR